MTNPFSGLAKIIQEDHKKIEKHTVESLRHVLTTDIKEYGFDNENISDRDVALLLRIVGNIISVKCKQVYNNEI